MIKTVMIEDRPVELNSSMGWLYRYREQFGRDILPDIMPIVEAALEGVSEMIGSIQTDGEKKYLDVTKVPELMNSSAIVEMFIKLAGMEFVTVFNIFWAMAKNADLKIDRPDVFMNSFDVFPVDEVVPGLLYAIAESSISSKNSKGLLEKLRTIPSVSTWSQSLESTGGCE